MTLDDIKLFLRVDDSVEDSLIQDLSDAADDYLASAIDDYETKRLDTGFAKKADLAKKLLITDWYENRLPASRPVCSAVELIVTQLQLQKVEVPNG